MNQKSPVLSDKSDMPATPIDESTPGAFLVHASKPKLIALLTCSLGFVSFGITVLPRSLHEHGSERLAGLTLCLFAASFFGYVGLFALRLLLSRAAILILAPDGFLDRSTAIAGGYIPWTDVDSVYSTSQVNQKFLCVSMFDPAKLINRQPLLKRLIMRINVKSYGGPITLSTGIMKVNHRELEDQFDMYLFRSRKAGEFRAVGEGKREES